ncbi:MAG: hypothetical protein ABIH23_05150, partial [bacterium]
MNRRIVLLIVASFSCFGMNLCDVAAAESEGANIKHSNGKEKGILGTPGLVATYQNEMGGTIPGSVVKTLSVALGPVEERQKENFQWLRLQARKASGEQFSVWLLTKCYPSVSLSAARETTARYILQEGESEPLEFRHQFSRKAVLPSLGAWSHLFPHTPGSDPSQELFPRNVQYLGHPYSLENLAS